MSGREHDNGLLAETLDLLGDIQTMLHAATVNEQIAIEQATQAIYGPNEGNHYNQLTNHVDDLRNRIHKHLEN